MSELISGKEAWNAKSDGENVLWSIAGLDYGLSWQELTDKEFMNWDTGRFLLPQTKYRFKLKPSTIKLNGIEVPAPFDPKDGDVYFYMTNFYECGYDSRVFNSKHISNHYHIQAWRTEGEIVQVVAALRSIFNESN